MGLWEGLGSWKCERARGRRVLRRWKEEEVQQWSSHALGDRRFSPSAYNPITLQGYQDSRKSHGDNRPYGGDGYDYAYPDNYNNFGYDNSNDGRDDRSHRYPPQSRKKHVASEPSPHVIFLGLDLDFTESDVSTGMRLFSEVC